MQASIYIQPTIQLCFLNSKRRVCLNCKDYVPQHKIGPEGLGGTVTKAVRLVGPNGGRGNCSDGSTYKEQVIDENGMLRIIR